MSFQDSNLSLLEEGLVKLGLGGNDKISSLLKRYVEEIELFNPAYGLVKVQDSRELIIKHIFDSLAPISILCRLPGDFANNAKAGPDDKEIARDQAAAGRKIPAIADVGSGAGLPGIPLAVCMNDAEFTLIERMGRRAGFLRNTLAVLGLVNVHLEETDVEQLASKSAAKPTARSAGHGRFDIIVFRAFKPLESSVLKTLFTLLASGGCLVAYKGRRQSIEEEMAQALNAAEKGAGPIISNWEALPLEVPFLEEERHLLLVKP